MIRSHSLLSAIWVAFAALSSGGCERSTDALRPFPLSTDPVVFGEPGVDIDFQAFLGSKLDAVSIDTAERHSGTASVKVTVPAPGGTGTYAGGAFVTSTLRDLSGYDALTFWAKASRTLTLDVAGLGNDNTGTSRFEARRNAIPITTTWSKFIVPIPLPARLASERGLFFFAEGPEGGLGAELWFDDVRFERTNVISNPRPSMTTRTFTSFVGATVSPSGTQTIFDVDGAAVTVGHMPGYLDFTSNDPAVATTIGGVIRVTGAGVAQVAASLGGVPATGGLTVNAIAAPATPAPAPVHPQSDVISLFSNAYANVAVDTWSAPWDAADVTDLEIAGTNDIKAYSNMVFAGIEFRTNSVDATTLTHFHLDAYIPNGTTLRVKLVDFGANGIFGGDDDREQELSFNASTTPSLVPRAWSRLDIPLADFTGLTTRAHVSQLVLSGTSTVFIDNVYFHR